MRTATASGNLLCGWNLVMELVVVWHFMFVKFE